VARPRAGRLAARAANAGNEAVAESAERSLEVGKRGGSPVSSLGTRNSTGAGEGDVENIVGIVGCVAVDSGAIAGSAEGIGDLTDQWWAVVAVGITPDTVELILMLVRSVFRAYGLNGLWLLTILLPQTTATIDRGSTPTDSGSKVT
jgi:hypothetical protein